jgi:hypothetical protein
MGYVPHLGRVAELQPGLEEHGAHCAVGEDGARSFKELLPFLSHVFFLTAEIAESAETVW